MDNRIYLFDITELGDQSVYNYWYEKMNETRKKKIDAFRFENGKKLSLGAGILLHRALNELGITEYDTRFGEREKPYIVGHEDIFFNLSHSGNMAALGISDKEIGVDIEKNRRFEDSLIRYVFTEEERLLAKELSQCADESDNVSDSDPAGAIDLVYTRFWTAKESVMKHSGLGVSLEPKKIRLSREGGGDELSVRSEAYDCEGLHLTSYHLQGYQLTICSQYRRDELIIDFKG